MIGIKDIEQILIGDLASLMDVGHIYVTDDIPDGFVTKERITLHVKTLSTGTFFSKCFVEVNYAIPDAGDYPSPLLQDAERALRGLLDDDKVGCFDGTWYRYGVESSHIEKSDLRCHYVNVRVLFEILNVRK